MRDAQTCVFLAVFGAAIPLAAQTNLSPPRATGAEDATSNRVATIVALARMGGSDTNTFAANRESILRAVRDRDRGVRRAASAALARSVPTSVPTIASLLRDTDPQVREDAAEAALMVSLAGPEDALRSLAPDLERALDDPVWVVRRAAACALQRFGRSNPSLASRAEAVLTQESSPPPRSAQSPSSSAAPQE